MVQRPVAESLFAAMCAADLAALLAALGREPATNGAPPLLCDGVCAALAALLPRAPSASASIGAARRVFARLGALTVRYASRASDGDGGDDVVLLAHALVDPRRAFRELCQPYRVAVPFLGAFRVRAPRALEIVCAQRGGAAAPLPSRNLLGESDAGRAFEHLYFPRDERWSMPPVFAYICSHPHPHHADDDDDDKVYVVEFDVRVRWARLTDEHVCRWLAAPH